MITCLSTRRTVYYYTGSIENEHGAPVVLSTLAGELDNVGADQKRYKEATRLHKRLQRAVQEKLAILARKPWQSINLPNSTVSELWYKAIREVPISIPVPDEVQNDPVSS